MVGLEFGDSTSKAVLGTLPAVYEEGISSQFEMLRQGKGILGHARLGKSSVESSTANM